MRRYIKLSHQDILDGDCRRHRWLVRILRPIERRYWLLHLLLPVNIGGLQFLGMDARRHQWLHHHSMQHHLRLEWNQQRRHLSVRIYLCPFQSVVEECEPCGRRGSLCECCMTIWPQIYAGLRNPIRTARVAEGLGGLQRLLITNEIREKRRGGWILSGLDSWSLRA